MHGKEEEEGVFVQKKGGSVSFIFLPLPSFFAAPTKEQKKECQERNL